MTVKNKWTGNDYIVVEDNGKEVTLQRKTDGGRFTIAKSEYYFNYLEKEEKSSKNS